MENYWLMLLLMMDVVVVYALIIVKPLFSTSLEIEHYCFILPLRCYFVPVLLAGVS